MPDEYRVQLDVFTGPMDLLLYLVRRDELDIQDIPIARVTEQYLEYIHVLEQLDPNAAGDFLVMASTLVELKSRAILPSPPAEALDEIDDPRASLVRQLLEYKRFKDAAGKLGSAAEERAKRFVRRPADLPKDLQGVELEDVELWDLISAFGRVMESIGRRPSLHEVRVDETPLYEYKNRILDTLEIESPVRFDALLLERIDRAEIVGFFLALLELIRGQRVRAEQEVGGHTIYLFLLVEAEEPLDYDEVEPQVHRRHEHSEEQSPVDAAGGAESPDTAAPDANQPDAGARGAIVEKPADRIALPDAAGPQGPRDQAPDPAAMPGAMPTAFRVGMPFASSTTRGCPAPWGGGRIQPRANSAHARGPHPCRFFELGDRSMIEMD